MLNKPKSRNEKGFTLLEMSIVIVIVGLLVGGILVGQDLISNARVGATVAQLQKYDTAVNTFLEKYGGVPGDIIRGQAFLGASTVDGNGNGVIEDNDRDGTQDEWSGELAEAFEHLSLAGMVDGSFTSNATLNIAATNAKLPLTKLQKSGLLLGADSTGVNRWLIGISDSATTMMDVALTEGIQPFAAFGIDTKLDDGQPDTGSIIVVVSLAASNTATADNSDVTGTCVSGTTVVGENYELTSDAANCMISVKMSGN